MLSDLESGGVDSIINFDERPPRRLVSQEKGKQSAMIRRVKQYESVRRSSSSESEGREKKRLPEESAFKKLMKQTEDVESVELVETFMKELEVEEGV